LGPEISLLAAGSPVIEINDNTTFTVVSYIVVIITVIVLLYF